MIARTSSVETYPRKEAPNQSVGSALCTQCGLCCTGALHDTAVLDPDEMTDARELGLSVSGDGACNFSLPCPRLGGTSCTIYELRPRVCARYKCQLLQNVEEGRIELDAAVSTVMTAKQLVRETKSLMRAGMTLPMARKAYKLAQPLGARSPEDEASLQLRLTSLSLYLDKNFRNAKEGTILAYQVVDEPEIAAEIK